MKLNAEVKEMYNINSIIELPDYNFSNYISANKADVTTACKLLTADIQGLSSNDISSYNFVVDMLHPDTYIEVSYKDETDDGKQKSAKLNLHDFMLKMLRTIAWIAYLNINGLTKEDADKYYVPMSGTSPNNPISGPIQISCPGAPALSVDGSVHFIPTGSSAKVIFHDAADATNALYVELHVPLTAHNGINADGGITCNANDLTSVFRNLNVSSLTATEITGDFKHGSITATNITGDDIEAINKLTANSIEATNATITTVNTTTVNTTNLTAANLTATDLRAGGSENGGYALSAMSTPITVDDETPYFVKTKAIYGSTVGTNTFIASNIQATSTFSAVKTNGTFRVVADSANNGLSATTLKTTNFAAANIDATEELKCSAGGENLFVADGTRTTIKNASCTDLACTNIALLTARYACWA